MPVEEQTQYNQFWSSAEVEELRCGQRLPISSRVVSKLGFWLAKYDSPVADITFRVRKVSNDAILAEKLWGSASGLTGDAVFYEVTLTTPVFVNEEARILAEFMGEGGANTIEVYRQGTDVKPGEFATYKVDGAYSDGTSQDIAYRYTYEVAEAPTVTCQPVTDIELETATGNGNLTALGGLPATAHGVCLNTTGNPDINDDKVDNGAKGSTGPFTCPLTGLLPGTLYYLKAFAENAIGISYSAQVEFTTRQITQAMGKSRGFNFRGRGFRP